MGFRVEADSEVPKVEDTVSTKAFGMDITQQIAALF